MQDARDPVKAEQLLAEGRALRALAQSLLGADGDDALQEAHAAALARPDAARRLGPWLAGTVRRLALRWRRDGSNRRAREAIVARGDVDAAADPARVAEAADTAAAVANAVRALDEPFRSAIVLRYWRGLSPEQIAAELSVPHNTVRSRLQRGLERLRAQLDAKYGERSRCSGALALLADREDTVLAAAASGGALLVLGVAMKTKLMVAAALLIAAAFTVPMLLDAPLAVAPSEPAAAPIVAAPAGADENANAASDREAAPEPRAVPAAPPTEAPSDQPLKVAPWLARFLVVDADDRPVADATVTVEILEQYQRHAATPVAPLAELRTDRDGVTTATFELLPVAAQATKASRLSARAMLTVVQDDVTKLVLETSIALRGVVRRGDGSPAAGAAVTARGSGFTSGVPGWTPHPAPATADAAGRFELQVLLHRSYNLSATLDGARTLSERVSVMSPTPDEVELVLPGGFSLRGVVVDANGKPAAGAWVRAWRERGDDPRDREGAGGATDATGRFAIHVKKRARYELIASAEGHANSDGAVVETTAERPHAEARLVLRSFATISGVVRHGDGKPFAGVKVVSDLDGWNPGTSSLLDVADRFVRCTGATSGADGRFTMVVDPGTPWNVVAYPLADNWWFRFTVAAVAAGRDDVVLTIRDDELAGCVVRGDVLTAAGAQPVTEFHVEVVPSGDDGKPRSGTEVVAKIDGHRFELPPLPVGRVFAFDVRPYKRIGPESDALHDTLAPVRVGPFTTTAAGLEVHARVEAWGEVPVQVLAADGKPGRDLFVLARREPEIYTGVRGSWRTNGSGRVLVKKCVPGPHRIVVGSGDSIRHEQDCIVTAGLNPEVIVRLPK